MPADSYGRSPAFFALLLLPAHMRVFSLAFCRDVHVGEGESRRSGGAGGRVLLGPRDGGGAAGAGGARVVAADVPQPVRGLPPLPAGARRHPARPELPARVLPGGLALQVRQQALHALTHRPKLFLRAC